MVFNLRNDYGRIGTCDGFGFISMDDERVTCSSGNYDLISGTGYGSLATGARSATQTMWCG